jgi:hypothetical protein
MVLMYEALPLMFIHVVVSPTLMTPASQLPPPVPIRTSVPVTSGGTEWHMQGHDTTFGTFTLPKENVNMYREHP